MLALNSCNCWTAHVSMDPLHFLPLFYFNFPAEHHFGCSTRFAEIYLHPPETNLLDAIAAFSQACNGVGMGSQSQSRRRSRDFLAATRGNQLRRKGERRMEEFLRRRLFICQCLMTPTSPQIGAARYRYLAQQMQIQFMSATASALNVSTCNICTVQTNKQLKLIYEHKTKCLALCIAQIDAFEAVVCVALRENTWKDYLNWGGLIKW